MFHKTEGGKKIPLSALIQIGSYGGSNLPPITDSSPYNDITKTEPVYVPCFSNQTETRGTLLSYFSNSALCSIPLYQPQSLQVFENLQSTHQILTQEHSVSHQEVPSSSAGPIDLESFLSYWRYITYSVVLLSLYRLLYINTSHSKWFSIIILNWNLLLDIG